MSITLYYTVTFSVTHEEFCDENNIPVETAKEAADLEHTYLEEGYTDIYDCIDVSDEGSFKITVTSENPND
jgi:hypothetical protein